MARVHVVETNKGGMPGPVGPPGPPGSLYPAVDFSASSGRYGVATGDLVTDAVRAARVEGDGKTQPDESVGIYGQRTNLNPNSGFEVDAKYWFGTLCIVARSTDRSRFGSASGKVTVTSNGAAIVRTNGAIVGSPIQSGTYTGIVNIYVPPGSTLIGKSALVFLFETGGAQGAAIASAGRTTSITLVAGTQEAIVTADVMQADRTELQLRIQVNSAVTGEIFYIDAAPVFAGAAPLPYVEASEALVPYAPSPNLATNGTFEFGTTGWSATLGTLTQSSEQAREVTYSGKFVVTSAGTAFIQHLTFVAGTPIPQSRHAIGAWIFVPSGNSVIGKTFRLSMTEAGGAAATAAIASTDIALVAGWQYVLVHGIPAQADRTHLRVLPTIIGAVSGDTIYVDDVRAGQPYTVPAPTTVTRTAGRLQVAPVGLSPVQGWVALRVRPNWRSAPHTWHQRPDPPRVLWQWRRDANNYLRLSFDGAYLVMERRALGVSDIARTPWAPRRSETALVVGAWTASGVLVSAEGRVLTGALQTFMSDDFERADGSLGSTPVGGFTWTGSGDSPPRILDGRMEPHASYTGNGYAYLNLGEVPYRWGGVVSYTGTEAALNTTQAYEDPSAASLVTMLHILLNRTGWAYQTRINSVWDLVLPQRRSYDTAIPSDGTARDQVIAADGDTVSIEEPGGGRYSFKDAIVASLMFSRVFWEVHRTVSTGNRARWESVFAQRRTGTPAGTGNVPFVLPTDLIDLGSDGTGAHLNGDVLWYAAGREALSNSHVSALALLNNTPLGSAMVDIVPDVEQFWRADDVS